MLAVVGSSTAYAVGQTLRGDWHVFGERNSDTVLYNVPLPSEAEVTDLRRRLGDRIEFSEPLLVNG
jgi:hypothetical protein